MTPMQVHARVEVNRYVWRMVDLRYSHGVDSPQYLNARQLMESWKQRYVSLCRLKR